MLIRQLEYLTALAREQHFARAALACHVSQPALSAGIRKLEAELDVPIVRRGNRFEGFTPEGERVLRWAYRILAERDGLAADVGSMRDGHTGELRIGVVPAAIGAVAMVTVPFGIEHPRVRLSVLDMPAPEIRRGLADYEIDCGITYLGADPPAVPGMAVPLYRERYLLLTGVEGRFAGCAAVSWEQIAHLPLCLLTPDHECRRTVDAVLRGLDAVPRVRAETNSVPGLYAHVREGGWFGVLPHAWLSSFGLPPGMRALPLVDPEPVAEVGLILPQRHPEPLLVREFLAFGRTVPLQRRLDEVAPAPPESEQAG
ncbi:DNA-binding transcriptional LysR family regulator [Spinactinospora alkalitolerans]|uniref:DNA-binding transcriptional LysR family regulator n=1 Tax=Spinactinospora alkalitolerans TaxID=687207 RepID=A0A852TWM5_9ACTN|nr:LysR substrate-binding domain-containing protein [Spinactinospora alkalitolerans]NYE46474.1 DNA-binding transcriptional LysR family regulator [Spinactinospora alkalitolerans]